MSEQRNIVNEINEKLTGEAKKNALDFAGFLQTNDLNNGSCVVVIAETPPHISPWTIFFTNCDFNNDDNTDIKEFAWEHAHVCDHFVSNGERCGCGNQPGFSRTIFDKTFEHICNCPVAFYNPDEKTLDNVKKLMLMMKK